MKIIPLTSLSIDLSSLLLDIAATTGKKWSLKKKSDLYNSPSLNSNLGTFFKHTSKDIQTLKINPQHDNLSPREWQAVSDLANQMDITIKPSDKGGNTVIMDNNQYIHMCMNILRNHDWFRPIPSSLIKKYNDQFYEMVDLAYLNNINFSLWEILYVQHTLLFSLSLPSLKYIKAQQSPREDRYYRAMFCHRESKPLCGWIP